MSSIAYPPFTWRMLVRWGWLLASGLLVGLCAAWALSGVAVTASSSFTVRSIGPNQTPYSSARLALTYAQLIPEDPEILASMSRETGLSRSYIQDRFSVSANPETNVLFARFTGGDKSTALFALQSLTKAIENAGDRAGTQLGRTVTPVSTPVIAGGFSKNKALLLGALSGLMIAVSIALTLERRRPRIDRLDQLGSILPIPVSMASSSRFAAADEHPERAVTDAEVLLPVDWIPRGGPAGRNLLAVIPARCVAGDRPAADSIALAVKKGTPVDEIEKRVREANVSGFAVAAAFLAPRNLRQVGPPVIDDV